VTLLPCEFLHFHSRLIMSTHRDLEACKRLSSRKSKALGSLPRGDPDWREL
jgi:hypothetical protein